MKKKAFTLTELLVVVVIIGVLSAVVLPKFSKVIESRRTAEAESVMRAVRNEQEMRCTLDKNYTTNKENLAVWPKRESANYTYALNANGMSATRKDESKDYTLEIKTYLDGGICCRGSYCASLNKDYPSCDDYDAKPNTLDCVPSDVRDEIDPEPEPEPQPEPEPIPVPECEVPIRTIETQTCGCTNSGTKERYFDEGTCKWGEWSECSEKEENCSEGCGDEPYEEIQCECGTTDANFECGPSTGYQWVRTKSDEEECEGNRAPSPKHYECLDVTYECVDGEWEEKRNKTCDCQPSGERYITEDCECGGTKVIALWNDEKCQYEYSRGEIRIVTNILNDYLSWPEQHSSNTRCSNAAGPTDCPDRSICLTEGSPCPEKENVGYFLDHLPSDETMYYNVLGRDEEIIEHPAYSKGGTCGNCHYTRHIIHTVYTSTIL